MTTWTPYRDVMNPNKTLKIKLSDYAISNEALKEVQQVAEEFSKVTGFSSFTLDFLIPSDGMPVFHEMNRLEFSSMSHPAVRMLVAYLRYQKSIGKEGNEMAFRDFVGSVKEDKEKFTRLFYGRMLKFFERISLDNPKFKELLQIHQKTISEEYDMFRLYAPIWAIWNTRCGISSKN